MKTKEGLCANCGKPKEEHFGRFKNYCSDLDEEPNYKLKTEENEKIAKDCVEALKK